MPKNFPYYARFDNCVVRASVDAGLDKYLSKASLEDLKRLDIGDAVDLSKNIDLVGTIFNAAVINRLNRNDDGMATKTALAIKDLFIHKPHNLEHKSQRIVGHIVKAGWSTFGGNKMLSDEEVAEMTEPFNLVLGGVVYRLVDEKFTDLLIDASDETSDKYMTIATSWEVGFTDYHIVLGSKNLNEAEIVSDPEKIKELKKYLKAFGGAGKLPDGTYIGRLIVGEVGDVLPIGMAYTTRPAAEVEGVVTSDWTDLLSDEDKLSLQEENNASTQNNQENSSQTTEIVVKSNNQADINMKITDIKTLIAAAASKEGLSEASVSEFIASQLEVKAKEWEAKASEKENALKTTSEKAEKLEKDLLAAQAKISEFEASLAKITTEAAAKAKEEAFQTRMSAIASEFELSAKDSELVAKDIRALDDVAYASWYEKFSILADSKKKTSIAAAKEAFEAKVQEEAKKIAEAAKPSTALANVSTASTKDAEAEAAAIAKAALDAAKETTPAVPNATPSTQGVDLKAEWREAFGGENIKITR